MSIHFQSERQKGEGYCCNSSMEKGGGGGLGRRWKNKPFHRSSSSFITISISISLLSLSFLLLLSPKTLPPSQSPSPPFLRCRSDHRFLLYSPHSGFSNQVYEFKNAVLMAAILNRTLVVPPVLDHHAVALGSCPKFRVLDPPKLRIAVWDHVIQLIKSGRCVFCFFIERFIPKFEV